MKIGILGVGFVGSTLARYIRRYTEHELKLYDPQKGYDNDIKDCEIYFICVNAPTIIERKQYAQDLTDVRSAIETIPKTNAPIILKTTVLPGTTDSLASLYQREIYHSAEFLTMRTADKDMLELDIVAGLRNASKEVKDKFLSVFPGPYHTEKGNIKFVKNRESELGKYISNCFGALKVNYFNIIKDLCEKQHIDYGMALEVAMIPGFIEESHTMVPGPDGFYGFGNFCLPKDLAAFLSVFDVPNALHQTHADNNYFRFEKDVGGKTISMLD